MTTISLPAYAYEEHLPDLLDRLGTGDDAAEIILDFLPVNFLTPGAIVIVLAKIHHWLRQGKKVVFHNYKICPAFRYLQRINFFSSVGLETPEVFRRHDAGSRFVELRRIGGKSATSVEDLSTDIAYCLFPEADVEDPEQSGLFDVLQYVVSELATNVTQHAKSPGFALAQYNGRTDLIRVAIADSGIGVLKSFEENGSPLWKQELTDADALVLALRPKVSSKAHLTTAWGESINAGVGLTLQKAFCAMTNGHFFIASGNGVCYQSAGNHPLQQLSLQGRFRGTVCALSLTRSHIKDFAKLLNEAKQAVGLLPSDKDFGKFFT
jgi:hypothetical protein